VRHLILNGLALDRGLPPFARAPPGRRGAQRQRGRDRTARASCPARKERSIRALAIVTAASLLLALPVSAAVLEPRTSAAGHSHRFHVVLKLKDGLRGTPLARHAFRLEAEGWRWNVNPFLVAAIAGVESSYGAAACGGNAWGLGNCGIRIASLADGIGYATKLLRTSYLDDGLLTLERMGGRYAACGQCWADKTALHMRTLGSPLTLTYPDPAPFAAPGAREEAPNPSRGA
jgi:hypothetical protein